MKKIAEPAPAPATGAGAVPPFVQFASTVAPYLDLTPFHAAYYRVLAAFADGRVRRLIVTMPPQHGKSLGASTLLPAYLLGCDPDLRIAIACYSASLASRFNRRVQRMIETPEYAGLFLTRPSSRARGRSDTCARAARWRSSGTRAGSCRWGAAGR